MTKPNDRSLAYAIAVFDAVLPIPCGSLPGPSADADVADRAKLIVANTRWTEVIGRVSRSDLIVRPVATGKP